jgi:hypothetical protein
MERRVPYPGSYLRAARVVVEERENVSEVVYTLIGSEAGQKLLSTWRQYSEFLLRDREGDPGPGIEEELLRLTMSETESDDEKNAIALALRVSQP